MVDAHAFLTLFIPVSSDPCTRPIPSNKASSRPSLSFLLDNIRAIACGYLEKRNMKVGAAAAAL
jgi:hypothetical protein